MAGAGLVAFSAAGTDEDLAGVDLSAGEGDEGGNDGTPLAGAAAPCAALAPGLRPLPRGASPAKVTREPSFNLSAPSIITCSPARRPDAITIFSPAAWPRMTGLIDTVRSAAFSTNTKSPLPPRRTAVTGTTTALSIDLMRNWMLTNWLANKAESALANRALAFTVPVVVSTRLSSDANVPLPSTPVRVRSSAITSMSVLAALSTSLTRSCGTANTTSIGMTWVMTATPLASLLLTVLPTSTVRRPTRPLMGAVMRV